MVKKQPPQQPPPVMRMVVCYGKLSRMRFSSHRDFARAFERGLRRAEIPMAYSSGFNPHPRISYINPAPTGVESVAEYLVIALRETCDPADVRIRLAESMPEDFPIIEVHEAVADESWEASQWEVRLPNVETCVLKQAVEAFLAKSEVQVSREVKTGLRHFDARGPVEALTVVRDHTLSMVIRHTDPLVRPSDVVQALLGPTDALIKRLHQGSVDCFLRNADTFK